MKPSFKVAYDGATEYTWKGKLYECRHHQASTVKAECQASYDRLIGTVICRTDSSEFPPAELMEHFPGFVRARYRKTGTFHDCHWTGGTLSVPDTELELENAPSVIPSPLGLVAVAVIRERLQVTCDYLRQFWPKRVDNRMYVKFLVAEIREYRALLA